MPPKNIRDYFQLPQASSLLPKPTIISTNAGTTPTPHIKAHIIKSSDDEESDSDSDLEDITELFQSSNSVPRTNLHAPITPVRNGRASKYKKLHASPLAVLPKYQFDLKALASEARKHEAADARALRMKALLEEEQAAAEVGTAQVSHTGILESVMADKDDGQVEKVMRAVHRTEATHSQCRWYFFDSSSVERTCAIQPFPNQEDKASWLGDLLDCTNREQTILSGFVRDMVSLGYCLPDEILRWMLDELCFESRDDLRQAYYEILLALPSEQACSLLQPQTVKDMARKFGGSAIAVNTKDKLRAVPAIPSRYNGLERKRLLDFVGFLGRVAERLCQATREYTISLLIRLCADSSVLENLGHVFAIQECIRNMTSSIEERLWDNQCRSICSDAFYSIEQASLRARVLQCFPASTSRLHDLRRRLALAYLFEDFGKSTSSSYDILDLWEVTKLLEGSRFKIMESTDYYELAALMIILDIVVDNGLSVDVDLTDPVAETEFNTDVDALAQRLKALWSSINDSGASFVSRIDAKEVMEGVRHRLIYAVRSKPKPKRSIFDSVPDDTEQIVKQSAMMSKYFGKSNG